MSQSLEKAVLILDAISVGPMSLGELTERVALPRSTTYRLASILVKHRILDYRSARYHLGVKLVELGERSRLGGVLPTVAKRHMLTYSQLVGETMHLAVLDGSEIVLLEKVAGPRQLQTASAVGFRAPAYRTSVGKALIAGLPEQSWSYYLTAHDRLPEERIARLRDELHAIRENGYALDIEESNVGIYCIAAPIRNGHGQTFAAVSFNTSKVYLSLDELIALSPTIMECARVIEADYDEASGSSGAP